MMCEFVFLLNQNYYCDIILTIKLLTIYSEKIWISNEKIRWQKIQFPRGSAYRLRCLTWFLLYFSDCRQLESRQSFSQHIVCNRSSDMPCFRRSQSTLEADCRCCKEKHMADVRTNANFYANRIYYSDNNAHCWQNKFKRFGNTCRIAKFPLVHFLRNRRNRNDFDDRSRIQSRLLKPKSGPDRTIHHTTHSYASLYDWC